MYKIGMFGGTFNPLHLGHVDNIIEASTMCEKLYVILFYSNIRNEIDHKIRFKWLNLLTKNMENVVVIEIEDNDKSKEEYNWEKGRDDVISKINANIDIVFCGDDYKGTNRFESLYPQSIIHYFRRDKIMISSTKIRENPYKYFEFLPKLVRPYYCKKIVIIGTESCGKSTLVKNLSKIYNTTYVEELGREVCTNSGGIDNMVPNDFIEIMFRHKAKELEAIQESYKVLFIDTEATVTLYYLKLLFDNKKEKIDEIIELGNSISKLNNDYLYIFLEPDVKWVQDGTRTYGEDEIRNKNNVMLKEMLDERNINYEVVSGNYRDRLKKVKQLVDKSFRCKTNILTS